MEGQTAPLPWYLLLNGSILLSVAIGLTVRPGSLEKLCTALGSRAPTRRECVAVSLLLFVAAGGLLFTFFAETTGDHRPYWMVLTTLIWFPLAGVCVLGTALWLAVLRRFI